MARRTASSSSIPTLFAALFGLLSAGLASAANPAPSAEATAFFEARIRPVLVESCYSCHSVGPGAKVKGDLRLDTREATLKGGATGQPSVVPGNPDASLLIKAIRYADQDLLMPPKKRLPPEVVKDFETWVKMGAPDPRTTKAGGDAPHEYKPPAADSAEAKSHW